MEYAGQYVSVASLPVYAGTGDDAGRGQYVPLAPDDTPPVVTFSPAPGTPIGSGDPITVTVTDANELRRVVIHAAFAGRLVREVVYDGDAFAPLYQLSTRSAVAGGWRYDVRRSAGWPSVPTLDVFALDAAGNEG